MTPRCPYCGIGFYEGVNPRQDHLRECNDRRLYRLRLIESAVASAGRWFEFDACLPEHAVRTANAVLEKLDQEE